MQRWVMNWAAMAIAAFLLSSASAGTLLRVHLDHHRRPSALDQWASVLLAAAAIGVGLAAMLWGPCRPPAELRRRIGPSVMLGPFWIAMAFMLWPVLGTGYLLLHPDW